MIWSNPSLFTDENPKSLKNSGVVQSPPKANQGWNQAAALISSAGFIQRTKAQFGMLPKTCGVMGEGLTFQGSPLASPK